MRTYHQGRRSHLRLSKTLTRSGLLNIWHVVFVNMGLRMRTNKYMRSVSHGCEARARRFAMYNSFQRRHARLAEPPESTVLILRVGTITVRNTSRGLAPARTTHKFPTVPCSRAAADKFFTLCPLTCFARLPSARAALGFACFGRNLARTARSTALFS